MFKVIKGLKPSRPPEDICTSRRLDDEMWSLIEDCWNTEPTARPTASGIATHLSLQPKLTIDQRPPHDWDDSCSAQLRSSLQEHPFCPTSLEIEAILSGKDSEGLMRTLSDDLKADSTISHIQQYNIWGR